MTSNFEILYQNVYKNDLIKIDAYPYTPMDTKWFYKIITTHSYLMFITALLIYTTINNIQNKVYFEACGNVSMVLIYVSILYNLVIWLWYRKTCLILFDNVKKDYRYTEMLSPEEKNIVLQHAIMGEDVKKLWRMTTLMCAFTYPLKSIILMIYYGFKDDFKFVVMYPFKYPERLYFMEEGGTVHFLVSNVLFSFLIYGTYSLCNGLVPLGPVLLLHMCGKLGLVEHRVKALFPDTGFSPDDIRMKLRAIERDIQSIYEMVEEIQRPHKVLYELQLKFSTLIIPLSSFMILEAIRHKQFVVESVPLLIATIILCSLPCYYSDKLLEKGESLRLAIYSCGWEKTMDRRIRTSLLLMLMRCGNPVVLRILFRDIHLDSLTDIFRQSYTLFNLFYAVWK